LHSSHAFSALTLLVGRQEGHLACKNTEWWGAGVVICLEQGAGLHMAQLMPLSLTVSCSSKIQIGFTFLVSAHLGSPRQRAVKRVCVCVHVRVCIHDIDVVCCYMSLAFCSLYVCVHVLGTLMNPATVSGPINMLFVGSLGQTQKNSTYAPHLPLWRPNTDCICCICKLAVTEMFFFCSRSCEMLSSWSP